MSVMSGLSPGLNPTVYRTVTGSTDLKTVLGGLPARCAAQVTFTNAHGTNAETAVFTGPDATNVTLTVPAMTAVTLYGNFSTLGALGADITCVVGWIDDGSVKLNG